MGGYKNSATIDALAWMAARLSCTECRNFGRRPGLKPVVLLACRPCAAPKCSTRSHVKYIGLRLESIFAQTRIRAYRNGLTLLLRTRPKRGAPAFMAWSMKVSLR